MKKEFLLAVARGETTILVDTEEKAREYLKGLQEVGIEWESGEKPLDLLEPIIEEVEEHGHVVLAVKSRWLGPFIKHKLIYYVLEED